MCVHSSLKARASVGLLYFPLLSLFICLSETSVVSQVLHLHMPGGCILQVWAILPNRLILERKKIAYSAQISDVTFHLPLFPPGATVASRCLLQEWMGVRLHISLIVSLAVTVESANSLDQRLIAHPGARPFKIKAKALKRHGALGDKLLTAVF